MRGRECSEEDVALREELADARSARVSWARLDQTGTDSAQCVRCLCDSVGFWGVCVWSCGSGSLEISREKKGRVTRSMERCGLCG
ncbi:hypothetical protein Tco_0708331 [Tanacetum coccineum]